SCRDPGLNPSAVRGFPFAALLPFVFDASTPAMDSHPFTNWGLAHAVLACLCTCSGWFPPLAGAGRFAIAELRQDHLSLCDGAAIAISESRADALFKGHPGTQ